MSNTTTTTTGQIKLIQTPTGAKWVRVRPATKLPSAYGTAL